MKLRRFLVLVTVSCLLVTACSHTDSSDRAQAASGKTPLVVFAAGSLIIPFSEIETAFEAKYPEIDVLEEYHGSIQVLRHVTELHEEIDVVAGDTLRIQPELISWE